MNTYPRLLLFIRSFSLGSVLSPLEGSALRCEIPEHFDQCVWEGIEVDVEFSDCKKRVVSGLLV